MSRKKQENQEITVLYCRIFGMMATQTAISIIQRMITDIEAGKIGCVITKTVFKDADAFISGLVAEWNVDIWQMLLRYRKRVSDWKPETVKLISEPLYR